MNFTNKTPDRLLMQGVVKGLAYTIITDGVTLRIDMPQGRVGCISPHGINVILSKDSCMLYDQEDSTFTHFARKMNIEYGVNIEEFRSALPWLPKQKPLKGFTDYPLYNNSDNIFYDIEVQTYDRNKYAIVKHDDKLFSIKLGYIYQSHDPNDMLTAAQVDTIPSEYNSNIKDEEVAFV